MAAVVVGVDDARSAPRWAAGMRAIQRCASTYETMDAVLVDYEANGRIELEGEG